MDHAHHGLDQAVTIGDVLIIGAVVLGVIGLLVVGYYVAMMFLGGSQRWP